MSTESECANKSVIFDKVAILKSIGHLSAVKKTKQSTLEQDDLENFVAFSKELNSCNDADPQVQYSIPL